MKIAQFRFKLEDGSPLILTYNLQLNSVSPKWEKVVNDRKVNEFDIPTTEFGKAPLELKIQNKTRADLPRLMEKLNTIITSINEYYDDPLPLFTNTNEIDHKILNYLHEEFERYGERHGHITPIGYRNLQGDPDVWPGRKFKVEFHQLWLDLNQYIHITETALDTSNFPNFSCLVQYTPFIENGAPIEDEDKLFLHNRYTWGSLYLGYNTLGKDYAHTQMDNDQRVIANDQIKVQTQLSSEVWLNFSSERVNALHKAEEYDFWKWYKNLPVELQSKVPIGNINALALGRYYLGVISFDETFLKFHPNKNDWEISNSELRKKWNLEVFSKIVEVTGIKILDV